jgi:hypothetical protein
MDTSLPALAFGGCLMLLGASMIYAQQRGLRLLAADPLETPEAKFLRRRGRRRTQVAGMIVLIGAMIAAGDSLFRWQNAPGTFAVYWMIVLALAIWTGAISLADMAATRAHMTTELNRLRRQELALKEVAQKLQEAQGRARPER